MVSYHYQQQPQSSNLPLLLLGVFCVLLALVVRFGWEYLMWIWRRGGAGALPPGRREGLLRHRGSPRRSQPPPVRKGKQPLEYYEEEEDYYDYDNEEEVYE